MVGCIRFEREELFVPIGFVIKRLMRFVESSMESCENHL